MITLKVLVVALFFLVLLFRRLPLVFRKHTFNVKS